MTRQTLREVVARLAPGTALRDGLERILRGRTGALIVLGHDEHVETICDGGFSLDVRYAPTRLRELSKMDGAVVLSTDGSKILRANVQLVPDPSIATDESGTRHRSAERAAIQTGYPVISVSHSMNIVTVYVGGERHVLTDSATILSRANQAIATLERYKIRLDEVSRQLSRAEIEDFVTLREVMTVVQRLELVAANRSGDRLRRRRTGHRRASVAAAAGGAAGRQRHRAGIDRARLSRQPRAAVQGANRQPP